ncbi:hypothetical protein AB0C15_19110 [Micromonospora sp. NPDC048835]|uniref:hypothetical protein n=1 Tax=Micromonospora sp. NPDC048835 TaxID=3155147 RepID=UPI0033DD7547
MQAPSISLSAWLIRADLGDLATWVGALANVATLAFALVAAFVGFRVHKIESGRDQRAENERRQRALDRERDQASLVSAWFSRFQGVHNVVYGPSYGVMVLYRWHGESEIVAHEELRVVPPHQDAVRTWPCSSATQPAGGGGATGMAS